MYQYLPLPRKPPPEISRVHTYMHHIKKQIHTLASWLKTKAMSGEGIVENREAPPGASSTSTWHVSSNLFTRGGECLVPWGTCVTPDIARKGWLYANTLTLKYLFGQVWENVELEEGRKEGGTHPRGNVQSSAVRARL
jgi:hypothetical protein